MAANGSLPMKLLPRSNVAPKWGYLCAFRINTSCKLLPVAALNCGRERERGAQSLVAGTCMIFIVAALSPNALADSLEETFNNVPRNIQGSEKGHRIQKPISPKAERCTKKCVSTCISGGAGAPGEGPLNIRRPLVVFKEGFRTRNYCLVECSDICNLIGEGDDGP